MVEGEMFFYYNCHLISTVGQEGQFSRPETFYITNRKLTGGKVWEEEVEEEEVHGEGE